MKSLDRSLIRLDRVNHWFGTGETRIQVIYDASLSIERGSFTVLRGPSGSGKTTLLTLMGCLRTVHDGSVRLFGQELRGASAMLQEAIRRRFGFIFQAHNLHESLTARQNTLMGLAVWLRRVCTDPHDVERAMRLHRQGKLTPDMIRRFAQ